MKNENGRVHLVVVSSGKISIRSGSFRGASMYVYLVKRLVNRHCRCSERLRGLCDARILNTSLRWEAHIFKNQFGQRRGDSLDIFVTQD